MASTRPTAPPHLPPSGPAHAPRRRHRRSSIGRGPVGRGRLVALAGLAVAGVVLAVLARCDAGPAPQRQVLRATPSPSPASSSTSSSDTRYGGTLIENVYVTAYTWFDNTPPGSARVSHPVVHDRAGGTGTWQDPITLAVGHDLSSGRDVLDFPAGTRFYLPFLQRYAVVEDTCGDGPRPQNGPCHDLARAPKGSRLWLDVWVGGEGEPSRLVRACAGAVTGAGGRSVVLWPRSDLPVREGPIFDGTCDLP